MSDVATPTAELRLHGAGVRFGERWAVRGADVVVGTGRLTVLVGPNGSGKSTLMRMLAGRWRASEGHATLDDVALDRYGRRALAKRIAWVPQTASLQYEFTVREVVAMGRYPHEGRLTGPRDADTAAIDAAMAQTDITALADRYVTQLSGGELQRVLLARCLATEAQFLMLDEPTSHLDLAHALALLAMCRRLAHAGHGVCLAMHDLAAALHHADEVVCLSEGEVVSHGGPHDVLTPERIRDVFGVHAETVQIGELQTLVFCLPREATRNSGDAAR